MSHCDFPILKGTLSSTSRLRATGGRNSFQSSKELYLPAARGRDREGKLLSNPQRNFIFLIYGKISASVNKVFPILKGTLSSGGGFYPTLEERAFQSSKELYLRHRIRGGARHGISLSNPQRNFIFVQG